MGMVQSFDRKRDCDPPSHNPEGKGPTGVGGVGSWRYHIGERGKQGGWSPHLPRGLVDSYCEAEPGLASYLPPAGDPIATDELLYVLYRCQGERMRSTLEIETLR